MADNPAILPGLAGTVTLTVSNDDTAIAHRSGDVPVLATPRVVALLEEAACAALDGHLELDQTSVGSRMELDHLKPTFVGGEVTATATLASVDGRKLDFTVSLREGEEEVARGTHRRVLVPRDRFGG